MFDKKDAINTQIRTYGKDKKKSKFYLFKCETCPKEIWVAEAYVQAHKGKCRQCNPMGRPYYATYSSLVVSAKRRNHINTITYKDFLEFTKIDKCHYCWTPIKWNARMMVNGKATSRAYQLDRVNNSLGYSVTNCVVCCHRCNDAKSNLFTYQEWFGMTQFLRNQSLQS